MFVLPAHLFKSIDEAFIHTTRQLVSDDKIINLYKIGGSKV